MSISSALGLMPKLLISMILSFILATVLGSLSEAIIVSKLVGFADVVDFNLEIALPIFVLYFSFFIILFFSMSFQSNIFINSILLFILVMVLASLELYNYKIPSDEFENHVSNRAFFTTLTGSFLSCFICFILGLKKKKLRNKK